MSDRYERDKRGKGRERWRKSVGERREMKRVRKVSRDRRACRERK